MDNKTKALLALKIAAGVTVVAVAAYVLTSDKVKAVRARRATEDQLWSEDEETVVPAQETTTK